MNIKNFLLPMSLALLTTWAIQYFVVNKYFGMGSDNFGVIKSGQTFVAPQNQIEAQPLNREVDFIDSELANAPVAQGDTGRIRSCQLYFFNQRGLPRAA